MEYDDVLYYDGTNARSLTVRVLVFHEQLHLRKDDDPSFNESYPIDTSFVNEIGDTIFFYLDKTGLKHLQYKKDHPVAHVLAKELEQIKGSWLQKIVKQRTVVLVSVVLALVIGLYLLIVTLIPVIGLRLIGVQQEIKMGEKLKDLTLQEAPVFGNAETVEQTKILQSFADQLRLSEVYPIRVTVVNSEMVNAFALPGGNIVVYKGILDKISSPEELVALLAHESTHINERHSLRSLLRSTANAIIISIVFGDASGISGAIAGHAETLNGLRYSRTIETEADQKGMDLMLQNKVDIKGMKQLMQMLQKQDKLPGTLSFLSTHPLTAERVAAAEKYSSGKQVKFQTPTRLRELFYRLKVTSKK